MNDIQDLDTNLLKSKMTHFELTGLIKQYSNDTAMLSFHKKDHPAYIKLLAAGEEIVPMLLDQLKLTIGRDSGSRMDRDNSPWLLIMLLDKLTDCMRDFPKEDAGNLDKIRNHIIACGNKKFRGESLTNE